MQSKRPVPPPKPSHLSLLSFPRLSVIEAQGHQRQASQRSHRSRGDRLQRSGSGAFDGGYNTSTAYAEHLAEKEDELVREARTLFAFRGSSSNELSFEANTDILIHKEKMTEGWSMGLIPSTGQVGLLPCTYYALTAAFTASPGIDDFETLSHLDSVKQELANGVEPHTTGWQFGALVRNSVLGGRAEDWILHGLPASHTHSSHLQAASTSTNGSDVTVGLARSLVQERHLVESGPSWVPQVPSFAVAVHSPSKRQSIAGLAEYTIYHVTSTFPPLEDKDQSQQITVERRFSNFAALTTLLAKRLPGIALPPLPEKQYTGRLADDFIELRRGDLERWLQRVIRHPVVRADQGIIGFLGVESEDEWRQLEPQLTGNLHLGSHFYAHVFHPEFNVDIEESSVSMERFEQHIALVSRGVQDLRALWPRVREAQREISQVRRLVAYNILALVTGQRLETDQSDNGDDAQVSGACNSDGAWCWRDDCQGCITLTRRLKKVAEYLGEIADEEEDHANGTLLDTQNLLKDVAFPSNLYAVSPTHLKAPLTVKPVVETHKETTAHYHEAVASEHGTQEDEVVARCETVLNSTLAETTVYHEQRREDFTHLPARYLDGEIAHCEVVLDRLRRARNALGEVTSVPDLSKGTKLHPSKYERELGNPRQARPLIQPSAHYWDSAALRPVTVVAEGVGALWSGLAGGRKGQFITAADRGSIFGRFW